MTSIGGMSTGRDLLRAMRDAPPRPVLATSLALIDAPPDGGLCRGALVELVGPPSAGGFSLALAALGAATRAGETAALVDLGGHLDPQNAEAAGVRLERLLWLRPHDVRESLVCAETALSAGFPLVVLDLAFQREKAPAAAWLRLGRAADARRAVLLVAGHEAPRVPAAEVRLTLSPEETAWRGADGATFPVAARVRLTVERRKGERTERSGLLTLPFPIDG